MADIQTRLAAIGFSLGNEINESTFGEATEAAIRSFQDSRGIPADGIIGHDTWDHLVRASYVLGDRLLYLRIPFTVGDDVATLQSLLHRLGFYTGPLDGVYGSLTDVATREFQTSTGVHSDGIVGPETINALQKLKHALSGVNTVELPEREDMKKGIYNLAGLKIAIDSGHGASGDPGAIGRQGLREADAAKDIADRLMDLVDLAEGSPCRVRQAGLSSRTFQANADKADMFVSIHLNAFHQEDVDGTTSFYFPSSSTGCILAGAIQARIVEAIGSRDMGIRGQRFFVLRRTRMPAVLIEPCFITNPLSEQNLMQEAFKQKIAVAIFDGICRAVTVIYQQRAYE